MTWAVDPDWRRLEDGRAARLDHRTTIEMPTAAGWRARRPAASSTRRGAGRRLRSACWCGAGVVGARGGPAAAGAWADEGAGGRPVHRRRRLTPPTSRAPAPSRPIPAPSRASGAPVSGNVSAAAATTVRRPPTRSPRPVAQPALQTTTYQLAGRESRARTNSTDDVRRGRRARRHRTPAARPSRSPRRFDLPSGAVRLGLQVDVEGAVVDGALHPRVDRRDAPDGLTGPDDVGVEVEPVPPASAGEVTPRTATTPTATAVGTPRHARVRDDHRPISPPRIGVSRVVTPPASPRFTDDRVACAGPGRTEPSGLPGRRSCRGRAVRAILRTTWSLSNAEEKERRVHEPEPQVIRAAADGDLDAFDALVRHSRSRSGGSCARSSATVHSPRTSPRTPSCAPTTGSGPSRSARASRPGCSPSPQPRHRRAPPPRPPRPAAGPAGPDAPPEDPHLRTEVGSAVAALWPSCGRRWCWSRSWGSAAARRARSSPSPRAP